MRTHQMPTLIDCYIVKDHSARSQVFQLTHYAANRFVCQQQRNEIMKQFLTFVKFFFRILRFSFYLALLTAKFHYSTVFNTLKKKALALLALFPNYKPDDNLLSHWLQHYHRRIVVSRSCSRWEGVVPTCYGHQA
jgi:cellulose synthase/poly-beta-1,6-N-acetylglucosamine synthase-like glycosyltransferase